jgi:RNA polymerase sigma factor (TIGR02999 family)
VTGITQILQRAGQGDPSAADELLPLVYEELRKLAAQKLARETPGQTLQATALVHEAWLRLGGDEQPSWDHRGHFFAAAAEAMRRILIDNARRKRRVRHGGELERVDLAAIQVPAPVPEEDELLAVHEALDELAALDPRKAELVKLRFFVGLTFAEAAEVLGISEVTAKRDWAFARAWLYGRTGGSGASEPPGESKSPAG